jgi:hypothetical protein
VQEPRLAGLEGPDDVRPRHSPLLLDTDEVEEPVVDLFLVEPGKLAGAQLKGGAQGAEPTKVDVGGRWRPSGEVLEPSADVRVVEQGRGREALSRHRPPIVSGGS